MGHPLFADSIWCRLVLHKKSMVEWKYRTKGRFFRNKISTYYIGLNGRFAPIFYFNCENFLLVYIGKQKTNKISRNLWKKFHGFSKFSKNRILLETHFWKFNKPFLRSRVVPLKIWARTVQPSWRFLVTNGQTDRQAKIMYREESLKGSTIKNNIKWPSMHRWQWAIYPWSRVTEVRSKIFTPLETTGGNSVSLEGFEKMLFII